MINNIIEILQYKFFVNALIFGGLISVLFSSLGVFVVAQKNSNITHTIGNLALAGIAIGLFFNLNVQITLISICILGSLLIRYFKKSDIISNDSSMEIGAQLFMAIAIILISQMTGYKANIQSLLFGDILAIGDKDIIYGIFLMIIVAIFLYTNIKNLIKIIFSPEIALSTKTPIDRTNILFLMILATTIGIGIKILGSLLLGAYIVLPSNIAKFYAKNFKQMILFTMIISFIGTILGLFGSYFLNTPSGVSIIATLGIFLIISIFIKKLNIS